MSSICDIYIEAVEIEDKKASLISRGQRGTAEFEALHMASLDFMDGVLAEEPDDHDEVETMLALVVNHVRNEGDAWHLCPYPRRAIQVARDAMREIYDRQEGEIEADRRALAARIARDTIDKEQTIFRLRRNGGDRLAAAAVLSEGYGISRAVAFLAVEMIADSMPVKR
jgi:hypothetical protein